MKSNFRKILAFSMLAGAGLTLGIATQRAQADSSQPVYRLQSSQQGPSLYGFSQ
ncbi:hypothetical protein [Lactococcus termiticola]|uniref:Uncharacterized protein n=1 Tax=Lactococcus termiticola TaxID=2169526 RepID=A0A2R5HK32_9LACT|nr:hypothetical protein [Lactococcus termiticola]GBG97088.1 hypothetical protein NtB2_01225 [Lactococcus termiticola]